MAEPEVEDVCQQDETKYDEMLNKVARIKSLVKEIADWREEQHTAGREELNALLASLIAHVERSGRTLFEFHLCSRVVPAFEQDDALKEHASTLPGLWYRLDENERKYWHDKTHRLSRGLEQRQMEALANFEILKDNTRRTYGFHVRRALDTLADCSGDENPDSDLSRQLSSLDLDSQVIGESEASTFTVPGQVISETLLGHRLPSKNIASVIPKLVSAIADRLDTESAPTVRLGDVRIHYDPNNTTETGIAARLLAASKRGLDPQTKYDKCDPRQTFEWVLRPFAYFRSHLFPDILPICNGDGRLFPAVERSSYLEDNGDTTTGRLGLRDLSTYAPFTREIKDVIIKRILKDVSKRLENPGFWKGKLEQCFARPGLRSEEYEDLVEQQLHYMSRRTGSVVPKDLNRHA